MPILIVEESQDSIHLQVNGDMTIYNAQEDHELLRSTCINKNSIKISLKGVEEIDTSGIQNLLAIRNWSDQKNSKVIFVDPSETVIETLTLLNLIDRLEISKEAMYEQ